MRILIAENSFYLSFHGEAIFTKNLAEQLSRRGHQVLVVVNAEGPHSSLRVINGVQVSGLGTLSLRALHPNAAFPILTRRSVENLFRDFQPDIVHIQDHYPLCRSLLFTARRHQVKVVGTNHFMPENLAPYFPGLAIIKPVFNWILWHWMLELYNRLDGVAAPSRTAAAMVHNQGLTPCVVPISCGVDVDLFKPDPGTDRLAVRRRFGIDPDRKTFFFVGRVDREKCLEVIILALKAINRPDLQFVIAGNGTVAGRMRSLAGHLGLANQVVFTGFIPNQDLPSVLNSIDIFTMPSRAELLSIATLEAMACARPVLAAEAVALPELVSNGVNGLLFRTGSVEDAARVMLILASQSDRWTEMGQASFERAQAHSLEHTMEHYEDLYRSILSGSELKPEPPGGSTAGSITGSDREPI
jgi:glycosyltransferase involved in cell wall biosynthesis